LLVTDSWSSFAGQVVFIFITSKSTWSTVVEGAGGWFSPSMTLEERDELREEVLDFLCHCFCAAVQISGWQAADYWKQR
jgi:hypothetical protein